MAAPQLDDLGQQQPHPTRCRVDEGDVAGLHRIEVGREVARGQALHHHRGRRAVVYRVGNGHERCSRDRDPLRIASGRIDPRDPPAGFDALHALPHRQDTAHTFDAQNLGVGSIDPRRALPYADVHEIHAGEGDPNQCFAWTRHRVWALDIFQHLAATCAVHYDSSHRFSPILNDRSVTGQKRG
jgi:hypothetical protein